MAKLTQEDYHAIPWEAVESSNVARVAWVQTAIVDDFLSEGPPVAVGELTVEFESANARAYRYADVPRALFEDMKGAGSVGSFFASNIRPRFDYVRIEIERDEDA